MIKELTFTNEIEYIQKIEDKDFTICQAIVESILENVNNTKSNICFLSVECIEEGIIYEYSLEKSKFAQTLKENIHYYLEQEKYEELTKIKEVIKQLENEQK